MFLSAYLSISCHRGSAPIQIVADAGPSAKDSVVALRKECAEEVKDASLGFYEMSSTPQKVDMICRGVAFHVALASGSVEFTMDIMGRHEGLADAELLK